MENDCKSIFTKDICFTTDRSLLKENLRLDGISDEVSGLSLTKDTSPNPTIAYPLHVAAINNNFAKVNQILSESMCDVNSMDNQGFNALQWCIYLQVNEASSTRYYSMIQYLINVGVDVNSHLPMLNRQTTLHLLNHYNKNRVPLSNTLYDKIKPLSMINNGKYQSIHKASHDLTTDRYFMDTAVENRIHLMKMLIDAGSKNSLDNCFVSPFISSSILWRGFSYSYMKDSPNNSDGIQTQAYRLKYTENLRKQYKLLINTFSLEVREIVREALINSNIHLGDDHDYSKYRALLVKHGCQHELEYLSLIQNLFKDEAFDVVHYTFLIVVIDRITFEQSQKLEINSEEERLLLKWFLLILPTFSTGIFFEYFPYNWSICKLATSFSSQTLTLKLTFLKDGKKLVADIFTYNGNVILLMNEGKLIYNSFTSSHPLVQPYFENIFSVFHYFLSDSYFEISNLTNLLHSFAQFVMNIDAKPLAFDSYYWLLRIFIFLRIWACVNKRDITSVEKVCTSIAQVIHCPLLMHYLLQKFHNLNFLRKMPLFVCIGSIADNIQFWSDQETKHREEKIRKIITEENIFFPILSLFAHQINEQDSNGDTCLHIAARNNLIDVVKFLLIELNAYSHGINYDGILFLDLLPEPIQVAFNKCSTIDKTKIITQPYTLLTFSAKVLAKFSEEHLKSLKLPVSLFKFIQLHVHKIKLPHLILKEPVLNTKKLSARKVNAKNKPLANYSKSAPIPLQIPPSQHVTKFSEKEISLKIQPTFKFT